MLITLQFEGKEGPDFPPLVIPVSVPFFSWLPSFNQPFVECEIFSIFASKTLKLVLLLSTMDNKHSTIHFYHHHLRHLSHTSIIQQRLQLFNSFNGDAFYPLSVWLQEFKLIFWKKPISDKDTFKLFSFLVGKGCSPHGHLISHQILTSQHQTRDKNWAEKRARQLDFLLSNMDNKSRISSSTSIYTVKNGYTLTGKKDRLSINN